MSEPFIVDFAGVGSAKAGTSWIARCLSEHPDVCMAIGKETNFFTLHHVASELPVRGRYKGKSNRDLGLDWYRSRYEHHRPGQLRGEFSVNYIADPESPRLLKEHNRDIKLIFSFRNPVDVLYSGYNQLSRVQPFRASFEETLERYPHFLDYPRHHHNLQNFLPLFSRDQMHFILFDDIVEDSASIYTDLCRFLGIDETFEAPSVERKVNPRTVLRSPFVRDVRCAISSFFGKTPLLRRLRTTLWKLGPGRAAVALFRLNERSGTVEPMRLETRERLLNEYREDIEKLASFLDRDLSQWLRLS